MRSMFRIGAGKTYTIGGRELMNDMLFALALGG